MLQPGTARLDLPASHGCDCLLEVACQDVIEDDHQPGRGRLLYRGPAVAELGLVGVHYPLLPLVLLPSMASICFSCWGICSSTMFAKLYSLVRRVCSVAM